MLQKQLFSALIALSLPLSAALAADYSGLQNKYSAGTVIAAADPTAGADAGGSAMSTSDSNSNNSGGNQSDSAGDTTKSDIPMSDDAPADNSNAAGTAATGGAAAAGSTAGTSTGGDASLDSMWSESQTSNGASKNKKKKKSTKNKSKSNSSSPAPAAASGSASSNSPSDLEPSSSSNSAPATPATTSATSPSSSTSTSSSSAGDTTRSPLMPSDFGAYPASTTTTSTTSSSSSTTTTVPPSSSTTATQTTAPSASTTTTQTTAPSTPASATAGSSDSSTTSNASAASTPSSKNHSDSASGTNPFGHSKASAAFRAESSQSVLDSRKDSGASMPLCATHNFFQSDLVRTVSWPGVGPFKGDTDPNDLADPQENRLTLETTGDKLTAAELFLNHQPGNPQAFVNLQMVLDFMLEALGTKDKKISDFNGFLEKSRDKLIKKLATEEKPVTISSGPYMVSIASSAPNKEPTSYLISVKSKSSALDYRGPAAESSPAASESQSANVSTTSGGRSGGTSSQTNANTTIASAVPTQPVKKADSTTAATSTKSKSTAAPKDSIKDTSKDNKDFDESKPVKESKPPAAASKQSSSPTASSSVGDDLKQEFVETIRNWQSIKKVAVKTQDTSELAKVLSGKALDKQNVAIGWLVRKKDYYDLTPKGVTVDRYEEVSASPKRYAVYAQVKENSKLMDMTTNKQLSESEDQYNVKYTIERLGDHWSIYDSELAKPAGASTADQSKGKTKAKH